MSRAPYRRRDDAALFSRRLSDHAVPFTPDERPCRRCDHPLSGHLTETDVGGSVVRVCTACRSLAKRCGGRTA